LHKTVDASNCSSQSASASSLSSHCCVFCAPDGTRERSSLIGKDGPSIPGIALLHQPARTQDQQCSTHSTYLVQYCAGSACNVGWRQESDASCAYNLNVGAETRMRIISSVVYEVHDGGESCLHQREIPPPLGTIAPRQDNC
jgi:hypothetical protein